MKPRLLLSLVLFLCFANQFSQAQSTTVSGTVKGILLDKETGNPIQFVAVSIFKDGSTSPLQSFSSNENGTFVFEGIEPGTYRIHTDLIGYLPYNQQINVIAGQGLALGKIYLKTNSKILKVVEVTGMRSNMQLGIDKKTFSVSDNISSAGASASDVLKEIPSVQVDEEGTISLRNSSTVTILIDGKPAGLTSDTQGQVLEAMPAESIDKIEVITNPSSKYSPEGTAGILNIILKKDRKPGYYGSVRIGASNPKGYNWGGNFNYSSPKIDFFANANMLNFNNSGSGYVKRQSYTNSIDTSYLNTGTKQNSTINGFFFRGGLNYHFNDKQTLSLSTFVMDGSRNSTSNIDYTYLNTAPQVTNSSRDITNKSNRNNYNATLDYDWNIEKDQNLEASLTYGKRTNTNTSTFLQTNKNSAGTVTGTSYQQQFSPSNDQNAEFKVDYSKKLSDLAKLETGMKNDWTESNSTDMIYNGKQSGSDWIISNPNVSNDFDYHEWINAVYGTLSGNISPAFGYLIGLRGEETNVSFSTNDYITTDPNAGKSQYNRNYLNFFPSVFLSYNLSKESELQLNYSRRINRPRGRSLNPFENITDSTNISTGNPALNPEYSNAFELNFMQTWNNHILTSTLYHRTTEGVIQSVSYLENGIIFQSPSNATNSTSSGFEIVAKDQFSRILSTTSTVNMYYETMDAFDYNNVHYNGTNGFSWTARLNGTLMLSKSLSGEISGYYNAPHLIAQGKNEGYYTVDLGLRQFLLNRKLQVSLNVRNLFDSFKFDNTITGSNFSQETSNKFFGRQIRLNVTWNFGNLKPKKGKQSKQEENINENSMDMENIQ